MQEHAGVWNYEVGTLATLLNKNKTAAKSVPYHALQLCTMYRLFILHTVTHELTYVYAPLTIARLRQKKVWTVKIIACLMCVDFR